MKLPTNTFLQGLQNKQKQVGLWISMCSAYSAEVIAPAGYNWALIDMEHSPNDYMSVLGQLQAFAASETTAIVRPEWNNPVVVKRLMDLGVPGLLFPMIQSVEEAELAVASTRYPPEGIRGVAGSTRATSFGRVENYVDDVNRETAVLLQVETAKALAAAEDIAAVEGVDGIFFGPSDIAADLGKVGQSMDETVWNEILPVARALIDKSVPVGTLVLDADFAAKLLNDGFTFVACGMDTALLARASDALLTKVKEDMKS